MIVQCILLFVMSFLSTGLCEIKTKPDQRTVMHFIQDPYSSVNETSRIPPMWYRPPMPSLNDIPTEFKIPKPPKYFPEYHIGTEVKPKYEYMPKPARGKRSPAIKH